TNNFDIQELNTATTQPNHITPAIQKFTFNCFQCRQCVPICPQHLHRDTMMLLLKHIQRKQKPWNYRRYLCIRTTKPSPLMKIFQKLFVWNQKRKTPDLAQYMEQHPTTHTSLLFYPGCYIYSPDTIRRTQFLLDYLGEPYTILAGVSTCCGLPHYLQGEFSKAETCLSQLASHIKNINPKTIITGCQECLEALQIIKKHYHLSYTPLNIVEYLMHHDNKFPNSTLRKTVTFHDSCRYNRDTKNTNTTRKALQKFGTLIEMKHHQQTAHCCTHWNFNSGPINNTLRLQRLHEAEVSAPIMVCECLTCYEEFQKIPTHIEVIDILQLFEEALKNK
ncbi:MAG: (Fe-S)-binding protein, partial [Candidatus Thermoplasmatota archaeon]|nr:(Fe-S)-binding protein [Candidatus Thermoplasmatota archaeon]